MVGIWGWGTAGTDPLFLTLNILCVFSAILESEESCQLLSSSFLPISQCFPRMVGYAFITWNTPFKVYGILKSRHELTIFIHCWRTFEGNIFIHLWFCVDVTNEVIMQRWRSRLNGVTLNIIRQRSRNPLINVTLISNIKDAEVFLAMLPMNINLYVISLFYLHIFYAVFCNLMEKIQENL